MMLFNSLLVAFRRILTSCAVNRRAALIVLVAVLGTFTFAASGAAQSKFEAPTMFGKLRPSLATTQYGVINLHHVLGTNRNSQYPKILAINGGGRVLLSGDGVTLSSAGYIVNRDGSHVELTTGCPACDPTNYNVAAALALNDASEIVGYWSDDTGSPFPVVDYGANWALHGETTASVSGIVPGQYAFGNEYAVNDLGTAVGISGSTLGTAQGPLTAYNFSTGRFLGAVGAANACDIPGSAFISEATAIDDAGIIVGDSAPAASCETTVAVRYPASGAAIAIPVAAPSKALAINSAGTVVGYANGNLGPGTRAFLYRVLNGSSSTAASAATYLPFPAGYSATTDTEVARGIDSAGDVVGDVYGKACSACGLTLVAGFLYTGGHTYDLNALLPPRSGWHIFDAAGISDDGAIVGTGTFKNESSAPFLMRPLLSSST